MTRTLKAKNSGCYEISTTKTKMLKKNFKNCKKKTKLLAWKGTNLKHKLMKNKPFLNSWKSWAMSMTISNNRIKNIQLQSGSFNKKYKQISKQLRSNRMNTINYRNNLSKLNNKIKLTRTILKNSKPKALMLTSKWNIYSLHNLKKSLGHIIFSQKNSLSNIWVNKGPKI